jgi:hypothetical protein
MDPQERKVPRVLLESRVQLDHKVLPGFKDKQESKVPPEQQVPLVLELQVPLEQQEHKESQVQLAHKVLLVPPVHRDLLVQRVLQVLAQVDVFGISAKTTLTSLGMSH